jgi:hypothetical protein
MTERDWDKELAKIDAEMAKSANQPAPSRSSVAPSGAPSSASMGAGPSAPPSGPPTTNFGVYSRLTLAVAVGVGIIFWPYANRCGAGLAGYLGAVAAVIIAGGWSAVWTFRHRAARAHVLSLLLVLWGLILASLDVLPRVGYAKPTLEHPAAWTCS